ncbi:MAG: hypothetical protein P1U34_05310 [Coxiellaceae bacterium]|nr:hypothetical protein [Coxiellaceae bacterium]
MRASRGVRGLVAESKKDEPAEKVFGAGLVVVDAEKVESRIDGKTPHSTWRVTWRDLSSNTSVTSEYLAESSSVPAEDRRDRYIDRAGSTAVVKDLRTKPSEGLPLPDLVLKSFHTRYWPQQLTNELKLESLRSSSRYLRAQNFCSYVGERPSRAGNPDQLKPYVVMQKIGDGRNLFHSSKDTSDNASLLNSPEAQVKFIQAICRLLAFIEFFHQNEHRPILDIKAENLIPIRNLQGQLERLVVVDLDSSFGDSFVMTSASMTRHDIYLASVRGSLGVGLSIDFRILANVIAETCSFIRPDDFFTIRQTACDTIEATPKPRVARSPIISLFKQLSSARGKVSVADIIRKSFNAFDAKVYLQEFQQELRDLQQRYASVDALKPAFAGVGGAALFKPAPKEKGKGFVRTYQAEIVGGVCCTIV